ncbi:MAG: hypothetical protein JXA06_09820 [Bacteroidetes bacterium]|nr:hypothetical protein [Bacteroidota bacterium]
MKMLISVCFFLIISFLFTGCYTVCIVIPPDIDQPPIHPIGPIVPIGPIIIVPPDPQPVTDPPVVIIVQPQPAEPVRQDRREICVGHGPADQKPAAPAVGQRESHSGRNPIVSNPPSQTYSEQSGSRNDENTCRPVRDSGVKRTTR